MASPRQKKPHLAHIASNRALGKLVDRSHVTIGEWVKRPDWPFGQAPWQRSQVPDILRWAADNLKDSPADPLMAELRKEKLTEEIRKLQAQATQAETALARERANLHEREACEAEAIWRDGLYRKPTIGLPADLTRLAVAAGMPAETAEQFTATVTALVESALRLATSGTALDADIEGEANP